MLGWAIPVSLWAWWIQKHGYAFLFLRITPPVDTVYDIMDSQMAAPGTAAQRQGIQPVVVVSVNGNQRADVSVRDRFELVAKITVPPRYRKSQYKSFRRSISGQPFLMTKYLPESPVSICCKNRYFSNS